MQVMYILDYKLDKFRAYLKKKYKIWRNFMKNRWKIKRKNLKLKKMYLIRNVKNYNGKYKKSNSTTIDNDHIILKNH